MEDEGFKNEFNKEISFIWNKERLGLIIIKSITNCTQKSLYNVYKKIKFCLYPICLFSRSADQP